MLPTIGRLRTVWRGLRRDITKILANQENQLAMSHLQPLSNGYLPWSGMAIEPRALVIILNDIMLHKRTTIVECGSGLSTIYIARLFKQRGLDGRLFTIDHDSNWLELIGNILTQEKLSDLVTLIHAPLVVESDTGLNSEPWYQTDPIRTELNNVRIDLLLVDGPPGTQSGYARYPALHFFEPYLNQNFVVALDDITRNAEKNTFKKWSQYLEGVRPERLTSLERGRIGLIGADLSYYLS